MKVILLCVWAEWAILGSAKTPSIRNRAVCSKRFVPSGTLEAQRGVRQINGVLQSGVR